MTLFYLEITEQLISSRKIALLKIIKKNRTKWTANYCYYYYLKYYVYLHLF